MSVEPLVPTSKPPAVPPEPDVSWLRQGAWLVFLAAFFSMGFVHHVETGWNVNTRLALVFAVADGRTLSIDDWHDTVEVETGDKAFFDGHFYSDKIFGVSLLALPVYEALKLAIGGHPPPFQVAHYFMRVAAVSAPASASVALLWMLMVRLGARPRRALALTAIAFWGSLWYGYSTVFLPYGPGIACVLGALWIVLFPRAHRITFANAAAIGGLAGYAVLCDMIFGVASALVGLLLVLRLVDQGGFFGMRAFAHMKGDRSNGKTCIGLLATSGVCAALPVALFAWYCVAIFGTPTVPYEFEHDPLFREGMSRGFMGATLPSPHALWFLTLHPYRGLLFWSPWIAVAMAGAVAWTRGVGKTRILGWFAIVATAFHLLFNAGYYMWWGGWCMGPRLLLPAFAFAPIALAWAGRGKAPAWLWWTTVALGAVAIALNMPVAILDPQVPQGNPTALLFEARIGDALDVPQFVYWRAFFSSAPYEAKASLLPSAIGAIATPAVLLGLAAWIVPAKHDPFEEPELPFVQYDGRGNPFAEGTPRTVDVP